jgi:hypothetical protein
VADYVIFLTTLYDILFWWWLYNCNSDQNVCSTWIFYKIIESKGAHMHTSSLLLAAKLTNQWLTDVVAERQSSRARLLLLLHCSAIYFHPPTADLLASNQYV